jgi:hypothetical protein
VTGGITITGGVVILLALRDAIAVVFAEVVFAEVVLVIFVLLRVAFVMLLLKVLFAFDDVKFEFVVFVALVVFDAFVLFPIAASLAALSAASLCSSLLTALKGLGRVPLFDNGEG